VTAPSTSDQRAAVGEESRRAWMDPPRRGSTPPSVRHGGEGSGGRAARNRWYVACASVLTP